jgi:hypothetical protein
MKDDNLDQYLESLMNKVCIDLAQMYRSEEPNEHGLIFPNKRDGTLRISEQEAKLLFIQHLTIDKRFLFSVETPTLETYQQKGMTPISARVDLTLFGPDRKPVAHIELKAHNCTVEAVRKDLEKLLREKTAGMWFHTLERADRSTLEVLSGKFRTAFSLLPDGLRANDRSYLIAFFCLEDATLNWRWLRFVGDQNQNCAAVTAGFGEGLETTPWTVARFLPDLTGELCSAPTSRHPVARGKGPRDAFFVFVPGIVPNTAMHLSVRGGSYRLRHYDLDHSGNRPRAFTIPAYPSFEALRSSSAITRWIPLTEQDLSHSILDEPKYWCERIRAINDEYLGTEDHEPN